MKAKLTLLLTFCIILFPLYLIGQNKISRLNKILTLEGIELLAEIEEYRYSDYYDTLPHKKKIPNINTRIDTLELYWKVLNKSIALKPNSFDEKYDISDFITDLVNDILINNGSAEYERLVTEYKSLPDTSWLRDETFLVPMYQYQVYKEIDNAITNKVNPKSIIGFPENLRPNVLNKTKKRNIEDSKALFDSIKSHYNQRISINTPCDWYSFQSNHLLFYKTMEQILFNQSSEDLEKLSKFTWGGWCGTGSETFYNKKNLVELLILLRERDYLAVLGRGYFYGAPNLHEKTAVKFLELCGLDWIDYYTGAISSNKLRNIPSIFTKSGSDKAAQNLLELKDSIKNKGWYINKCVQFINPISKKEGEYLSFNNENILFNKLENKIPYPTIPVNYELKKILKDEIINISLKADEFYLCQSAINVLQKLKFDERVKDAFLFLVNSKYSMIRNNAAKILKKNGISIKLPVDNGKIKYRFLVDGKPLKQDKIRWELYDNSNSRRYFLCGSETTNEKGILLITSDTILDHISKIKKIIFYPDKSNGGGKEVIFYVESILPKNFSDTKTIHVSTAKISMRFHLNRDADFYLNKKMNIQAFPPKLSMLDFRTDIKEEFEFPVRFQKNIRCSFSADIPGALSWSSSFRDTIRNDLLLEVYLENGTTVIFKLLPPGGKKADERVLFKLEKKNESGWGSFFYYGYSIGGYESLPVGEYRLKISSSEEKKSKYQKNKKECSEIIPTDYADYEGKTIPFTITKNSPVKIDLGIIKLDTVKK